MYVNEVLPSLEKIIGGGVVLLCLRGPDVKEPLFAPPSQKDMLGLSLYTMCCQLFIYLPPATHN